VPVLVLISVAGSVVSPARFAPYFVKLFSIWSPYHFSGQTLGITLLYARRAGIWVGKWERLVFSVFIYLTFFTQSIGAEVGTGSMDFYGIHYPAFGVPYAAFLLSRTLMYGAMAGAIVVLGRWKMRAGKALPWIVAIPAASQFLWFVGAVKWFSFIEFVPFFHSLQYLLIAWSMQIRERSDFKQITPSKKYVWQESFRWGAINIAGGAALFYFIPHWLSPVFKVSETFMIGVFIAGVQIHHFFVDGVIWKLRNKFVSSPLMTNLAQFLATKKVPLQSRREEVAVTA
jgi:hypothetical protein